LHADITVWVDRYTISFVANQVRNVSDACGREGHTPLYGRMHSPVCSVANTPLRLLLPSVPASAPA